MFGAGSSSKGGRPERLRSTRWSLQLSGRHQFGELDVECPRNLCREHKANVLAASLNAAHVRAVYACFVGECFLREAERQPPLSNGSTERNELWCLGIAGRRTRHPGMVES
jgi:hypothetical protein